MALVGPGLLKQRLDRILQDDELQQKLADRNCVVRIVTAQSGRWVYVSDNSERILGIPAEDLLGLNAFDFVPADDVEQVREMFGTPEGDKRRNWYRTRRGDGTYAWVRGEAKTQDGFIIACIRLEEDPAKHSIHSEPMED